MERLQIILLCVIGIFSVVSVIISIFGILKKDDNFQGRVQVKDGGNTVKIADFLKSETGKQLIYNALSDTSYAKDGEKEIDNIIEQIKLTTMLLDKYYIVNPEQYAGHTYQNSPIRFAMGNACNGSFGAFKNDKYCALGGTCWLGSVEGTLKVRMKFSRKTPK